MEREHWLEISKAISEVGHRWPRNPRHSHPTALIARVYLWAVGHDRAINWACRAGNWPERCRPDVLPDQSTMSRRSRTDDFHEFLKALGQRLSGRPSFAFIKRIDGKPLPVAAHSTDRHATWGKGAGKMDRGYKLHALWGKDAMPLQWAVTPLDVPETRVAKRMIKRLNDAGYLLSDSLYDHNELHELARSKNHQLIAPRQKPGRGLGHRPQSAHRLRCIDMLESPAGINTFGLELHALRGQIERDFENLSGFGGGLTHLPPWIRRPWRVRSWVHGKLLINAARIRCNNRRNRVVAA